MSKRLFCALVCSLALVDVCVNGSASSVDAEAPALGVPTQEPPAKAATDGVILKAAEGSISFGPSVKQAPTKKELVLTLSENTQIEVKGPTTAALPTGKYIYSKGMLQSADGKAWPMQALSGKVASVSFTESKATRIVVLNDACKEDVCPSTSFCKKKCGAASCVCVS